MPQDILEIVFELVRGEPHDHFLSPHRSIHPLSWLVITHVCHCWRECAIGMKRLWRLIEIGPGYKYWQLVAAMTFLERSKPLHITLHHQIYVPPQSNEETLSINEFYARVDENRDRLARIFLYGTFHETAWALLQEGLPNLVEVSLKSKSPIPRYGAISKRQMELGPLLNGHSLSVRKLRLYDRVFTHNWYPNVTRLCLTNSDRSKTPDSA